MFVAVSEANLVGRQKTSPINFQNNLSTTRGVGGNEHVTARLAVASLPQLSKGTLTPTLIEPSGGEAGRLDELDWPPNLDSSFAYEDGQNEFRFCDPDGMPVFHDNHAIGNLLQSSFDKWAALEGTFEQPIDMDTVWY